MKTNWSVFCFFCLPFFASSLCQRENGPGCLLSWMIGNYFQSQWICLDSGVWSSYIQRIQWFELQFGILLVVQTNPDRLCSYLRSSLETNLPFFLFPPAWRWDEVRLKS